MLSYKESIGMFDALRGPTGMIIAAIVIAYVCRRILFQYRWRFTSTSKKRASNDTTTKDREAQMKAREAAERRQKLSKATQRSKKRTTLQQSVNNSIQAPKLDTSDTVTSQSNLLVHSNDAVSRSMSMEEIVAASVPVYDNGFVMFRNLFQMPNADQTAATLRRLAHEFIPIIQQRQYNVTSVSEFCCCGDGMDYQFGGRSLSVRPGERIAGHESERVMGYNRVLLPNGGKQQRNRDKQYFHIDTEKYASSIHLRLRSPYDHTQFIPYELVCENFCHELAHCVYHDHSAEFYALMRDIQLQYKRKVS